MGAAELQTWAKKCDRGGASDIHGWSDGLLAQALSSPEVAAAMVPVFLAIANNEVSPDVY